jgi:hypothetical protein
MRRIRLFDIFALLSFVASLIVLYDPIFPFLRSGVIYVSTTGSNWNSGNSPEHAVATIQHAADIAMPGNTIIILPGKYREKIYVRRGGLPGKPVTFKAEKPGTVTISNEAGPEVAEHLQWLDEGEGIFSSHTPWPIYFARADGLVLFRCYTLEKFRRYSRRTNAWGAFYIEGDKFYVSLPDKKVPAKHELTFHSWVVPAGVWRISNAANVVVMANDVHFEGLCFDFGVGYGIHIWEGENVTITDCLFTGAATAIQAGRGRKPAENLNVEHCLYHNYPQYEWYKNWLDWSEVYDSYATSTLLESSNYGALIRHNLVVDGADGLEVTTGNIEMKKGIDISENLIAMSSDDAIQMVGYAKGVHFHKNLVYDCHVSISLSPLLDGPVLIDKNLFLHPFGGINAEAHLKLLDTGTPNPVIRNAEIRENVFVGNYLSWYGEIPIHNVSIIRNTFAVQRKWDPPWPAGIKTSDNTYIELPQSGYPDPGQGFQVLNKILASNGRQALPQSGVESAIGGWKMTRPGPRWLDWKSIPPTARLSEKLSSEFFTQ